MHAAQNSSVRTQTHTHSHKNKQTGTLNEMNTHHTKNERTHPANVVLVWTRVVCLSVCLCAHSAAVLRIRELCARSDCVASRLVTRVSRIEFGQNRGRNTLEHLLGEDTQQLPTNVQRLEDGTVLVVTL